MQFSVLWGAVDGAVILAAATEEVGGGVEWAGGWVINLTVLGLEFCESQHYNVKETESVSGEQGQCGRWWNYSLSEERNTQK